MPPCHSLHTLNGMRALIRLLYPPITSHQKKSAFFLFFTMAESLTRCNGLPRYQNDTDFFFILPTGRLGIIISHSSPPTLLNLAHNNNNRKAGTKEENFPPSSFIAAAIEQNTSCEIGRFGSPCQIVIVKGNQ